MEQKKSLKDQLSVFNHGWAKYTVYEKHLDETAVSRLIRFFRDNEITIQLII